MGSGPSTQRLGRYHLSDCLGGGPTGEVFRAKVYGVAGMDRDFAVKRFHPSFIAQASVSSKIGIAARLYGALEHPRVARLHEFGEAGGQTFAATELVEGLDLSQLIDQGQLPMGTSAQLIIQVGRALGYAHGRGQSHLGLCPSNIICTLRGDIKVTDFGFLPPRLPARPAQDPSLLGRLCYLAPEQLEGQNTSPATDVYQLGTIAYQLLVGRKPYTASSGEALAEQMLTAPMPATGLPKPFDKLLKRALARSPFERFPDSGAMADAVAAALRASPAPGSLADAGKAVSKRQSALRSHRQEEPSGALSFPMPAPPKAPREEVLKAVATPPPLPSNLRKAPLGGVTQLGIVPSIAPLAPVLPGPPSRPSSQPKGGDTDVDAAQSSFGSGEQTFSDMATIPQLETGMDEVPALSEHDIQLGPAGTDPHAQRGQFIGGVENLSDEDEAQTLIRDEGSREGSRQGTLDDRETLVRDEQTTPRAKQIESQEQGLPGLSPREQPAGGAPVSVHDRATRQQPAIPEPPEIELVQEMEFESFESNGFSDLEGFDDEVSELLVVPPGAPESVEVPHFPTPSSGPISQAGRGAPREVPPPLLGAHLSPPGHVRRGQPGGAKGRVLTIALMIGGLGAGAFFGYGLLTGDENETSVATVPGRDAAPAMEPTAKGIDAIPGDGIPGDGTSGDATTEPPADGAAVASGDGIDAGTAAFDDELDAGSELVALPAKGFSIESKPGGAKIYLDGTLVGKTPMELEPSNDSHRLAVILPGYDLYTGDINGTGLLKIELREITPPEGPYGIKVRCVPRNKDRYYIYVDGDPVGQLCPSERIGVTKGKHSVEIYDPITDSRRAFSVDAQDTRRSHRLRVD